MRAKPKASFCGLIICLQQESIYLDKLTGVYNRYYLDEMRGLLQRRRQRFAGDEFVILLERPEEGAVEAYRRRILDGIERYNETSGKPYRFSAAVGGGVFDARTDDISDFVSDIDHQMYEEKKAYYQKNDRRRR